jgi:transcription elongation GreA/GreB family factor
MSAPDKSTLHALCIETLDQRLDTLKQAIINVQDSIETEEGSTAGDKYQTSRAMDQIELERLQQQQSDLIRMKQLLKRLGDQPLSKQVQAGSLVLLNDDYCYLCVPLGMVKLNDLSIRVISPASPLGRLMAGKVEGDSFDFQLKNYQIKSIL